MVLLFDNGHGSNTSGKCSPDGKYREWKWAREITARLVAEFRKFGYDARLVVPEERDIDLVTRCHRVNVVCNSEGKDNVLLVSIHSNAVGSASAGKDGWSNVNYWTAYTTRGTTESDHLAASLTWAARQHFTHRRVSDPLRVNNPNEANFYLLLHTQCPAVLTENFFHTCHSAVKFLQSEAGKQAVVEAHIDGILAYLQDKDLGLKR